jgi:hypothetical protein
MKTSHVNFCAEPETPKIRRSDVLLRKPLRIFGLAKRSSSVRRIQIVFHIYAFPLAFFLTYLRYTYISLISLYIW